MYMPGVFWTTDDLNGLNICHFLTIICKNYGKMLKLLKQMRPMDLFKNFMINYREIMKKI